MVEAGILEGDYVVVLKQETADVRKGNPPRLVNNPVRIEHMSRPSVRSVATPDGACRT
jgi:hypothetical protein